MSGPDEALERALASLLRIYDGNAGLGGDFMLVVRDVCDALRKRPAASGSAPERAGERVRNAIEGLREMPSHPGAALEVMNAVAAASYAPPTSPVAAVPGAAVEDALNALERENNHATLPSPVIVDLVRRGRADLASLRAAADRVNDLEAMRKSDGECLAEWSKAFCRLGYKPLEGLDAFVTRMSAAVARAEAAEMDARMKAEDAKTWLEAFNDEQARTMALRNAMKFADEAITLGLHSSARSILSEATEIDDSPSERARAQKAPAK